MDGKVMDMQGKSRRGHAERGSGSGGHEPERGPGDGDDGRLKTCPRCGARLFADMDVCYGCLYDFSKGASGHAGRPEGAGGADVVGGADAVGETEGPQRPPVWTDSCCGVEASDELWGSLDELWDGEAAAASVPAWSEGYPDAADAGFADVPHGTWGCGAGGQGPDVEDEMPLEVASMTSRLCAIDASEGGARVRVFAAGLALTCAVPPSGLTIGRDSDNDLALLSRSVSRRHVRLVPCDGGIIVQDLGATNPALLNGRMLVDGRRMWVGDTLEIRGSGVTIRPCPTR